MCFSKLFRKKENDMQYTENLELNLPEATDYIEDDSREAINDNFEVLDTNVVVKGDFAVVTGSITLSGTATTSAATVNYPTGFTYDNCIVVSTGLSWNGTHYHYNQYNGTFLFGAALGASTITFRVTKFQDVTTSETTKNFKLVLMKISAE